MKIYLQDIVNQLHQFSEKIDNISLFIDKPWVLIDSNSDYHKYIFKRNGELIMSLNGQVQIGKWEYLTSAKSILIDRIKDKILLNQAFLDSAVIILKIDGLNNGFFVLANEMLMPDLDVKNHLKSVLHKKFNVITAPLEDGKTLEVYIGYNQFEPQVGMKTTIEDCKPEDGKYKSEESGYNYQIKNGEIIGITKLFKYYINNNLSLTIEQTNSISASVGDLVYTGKELTKSGKYNLGILYYITVVNGVITKKSMF